MSNPKLSIDEVFKKQIYLNIISILYEYHQKKKNITMEHLKYLLIKNYKLKKHKEQEMKEFFSISPFNEAKIQEILEEFQSGSITNEQYITVKKILSKPTIETLKERGIFSDKIKIDSEANLRKKIRNLKRLEIIKLVTRKKGYPYYTLTSTGINKIARYILHKSIDKLIPDGSNAIPDLLVRVLNYGMRFENDKRLKKNI